MIQIGVGFVRCAQHALGWCAGAIRALSLCAGVLLLCHCGAFDDGPHPEVISHGQFPHVRLYRPPAAQGDLVLLLSGDGGWGSPLDSIAERFMGRGIVVAGIDVREWLATLENSAASCAAPGAYLADLGRYLQTRYALTARPPVLIGHSAGATLAYVALAQARSADFAGALTLSFCPDLDLAKPLCPGPALRESRRSAGVRLLPGGALPGPWIALHGLDDRECPAAEGRVFAAAIPDAHFVPLPGEGHSYADIDEWWGRFFAAYQELVTPAALGAVRGVATGRRLL
jgi:type IV secretory pathway VirJ component